MLSLGFPVLADPRQPQVHASTLLLVYNTLLVSWFGGSQEGAGDTKIWLSSGEVDSTGSTSSWKSPVVVASQDNVAHWNPVLFRPHGLNFIQLYYKVGSPISAWQTFIIESQDRGQSWSQSRELVPGDKGGRGPVKNKPISLGQSRILAPSSLESPDRVWDCLVDCSTDDGITWTRSPPVPIDRTSWPGEGAIQPSLLCITPHQMTMLCRSSTGFVARSDSADGGRTWCAMFRTSLYNNNSGLDAVALEDGTWLVVHNPVNKNWGPRTPLVISSSQDSGATWKQLLVLEDKSPPQGLESITALDTGIENDGESEFSYPAIIGDGHGGVYISYTYERRGIKVVQVDSETLSVHLRL